MRAAGDPREADDAVPAGQNPEADGRRLAESEYPAGVQQRETRSQDRRCAL